MQVPKLFFGSTQETRSQCDGLIRQAWTDGSWNHAFDSPFVDLNESNSQIVLRNDDRLWESSNDLVVWNTSNATWQFNWILERGGKFEDWWIEDPDEAMESADRHLELLLSGMNYDWFAIGMLKADPRYMPFYYKYLGGRPDESRTRDWSDTFRTKVACPLLVAISRHLPVLASLSRRYVVASGRRSAAGTSRIQFAIALGFYLDMLWRMRAIDEHEMMDMTRMPEGELVDKFTEACGQVCE